MKIAWIQSHHLTFSENSNYWRESLLEVKGKTLLGDVNKLFVPKSLMTTSSNVLPLHLEQTFPSVILIFTEGEVDGIQAAF